MSIEYAVILAIASPTHVSGLTKSRPHAMLPALGKPLVVRVMNQVLDHGIKKFIVVVGLNEGSVASYLNTSWVPDVELEFVLKSDYENLSTTLSQIARKIDKPFMILNYNTFAQPQFIGNALNLSRQYPDSMILAGTKSTLSQSNHNAFATVIANRITDITSTQSDNSTSEYLIANMAICGTHFIDFLKMMSKGKETASLQQQFIDILHLYTERPDHKITLSKTAWIMQVNSDSDLMLLNHQLLEDGRDAHILSEIPASVHINYPVRIDPGVSIGQGAVIGPYAYLESGASIGQDARVSHSIILNRASVSPQADVADVIIAPNKIIATTIN
jgi:NDP-sugar pyrophosphorylase family protein